MSSTPPATALAAVLDDLEASLDALGAALAAGDPQSVPAWTPPRLPAAPPTASERERLASLQARAGGLERRLAGHLRAVTDELASLRTRTVAATRYHAQTARTAPGGPAQSPAEA